METSGVVYAGTSSRTTLQNYDIMVSLYGDRQSLASPTFLAVLRCVWQSLQTFLHRSKIIEGKSSVLIVQPTLSSEDILLDQEHHIGVMFLARTQFGGKLLSYQHL